MHVVDDSGEFGSEVIDDGFVDEDDSIIYWDAPTANAACGAALYLYLQDRCKHWNPESVSFQYFPGVTAGCGVYKYHDWVTFRDGSQCDMIALFYAKNYISEEEEAAMEAAALAADAEREAKAKADAEKIAQDGRLYNPLTGGWRNKSASFKSLNT